MRGRLGKFTARRRAAYQAYFLANSEFADPGHTFLAKDFAAALPDSSPPEFEQWLPPGARHPHYRSGNSSQTLALGLLGIAAWRDPSLEWWWEALDVPGPSGLQPSFAFESKLAKDALGETGGATSVDFFAVDESAVICCECKWVEQGIGPCTCASAGGNPATGTCRRGIYDCAAYWKTAAEVFALYKHVYGVEPCRLGFAYQAVRNVAAALALAGPQQTAAFALVYDAENPRTSAVTATGRAGRRCSSTRSTARIRSFSSGRAPGSSLLAGCRLTTRRGRGRLRSTGSTEPEPTGGVSRSRPRGSRLGLQRDKVRTGFRSCEQPPIAVACGR